MVMEVVHEDVGEGNMQCTNHPNKNGSPGGICAFCLQEKLGKLVSSSYPVAVFPSSSSSPSPSFRSASAASAAAAAAATGGGGSGSSTVHLRHLASSSSASQNVGHDCDYRKTRLPFVLTQKKKKKKDEAIVLKRSKSTTTPRRGIHFLDGSYSDDYSPKRRRFWSFLHLSKPSTAKKVDNHSKHPDFTPSVNGNGGEIRSKDENLSPEESTVDRKVSRSRSVGCGSRSFSGDFFERISTGLGDCTLRRVESHREGKLKMHKNGQDCIKERVKCGGIFSGFMIASSSSSYLITSSVESSNVSGRSMSEPRSSSKSWVWAFASPMRAFGKNYAVKRDTSSDSKYSAPNLAAIPSLLAVSG